MIHIAFLLPNMQGGGAERVVLELISRLDRRRFNVLLCLELKTGEYLADIPKDVELIQLGDVNSYKFLYRLQKLINEYNIDILHSHLTQMNIRAVFGKIIFRWKAKVILTEHNNFNIKAKKSNELYSIIYAKAMRFLYSNADRVTTVSKGVACGLLEILRLKDDLVRVIYNPIDIDLIAHDCSRFENNLFTNQQTKFKLVAAGRLVRQKGFDLLIQALHAIHEDINFELVILGEGQNKRELAGQIKNFDLECCIKILGFVERPWLVFSQADLFIMSSRWEGFGNVLIESLAAGTPVLATNCNFGPNEIILNGLNGWLTDDVTAESIEKALRKVLTSKMDIQNARKNTLYDLERFNTKNVIKEYSSLYEEMLH